MRIVFDRDVPGYGYVSYIDDSFNMFYAPDVVAAVLAVFPAATVSEQKKLRKVLSNAKRWVSAWEIRDDRDLRHQQYVLSAKL